MATKFARILRDYGSQNCFPRLPIQSSDLFLGHPPFSKVWLKTLGHWRSPFARVGELSPSLDIEERDIFHEKSFFLFRMCHKRLKLLPVSSDVKDEYEFK